MIVISDTSVICNLFLVEHLGLIPQLFKKVLIPPKVYEELLELEKFDFDITPIINADFIEIRNVTNEPLVQELLLKLDKGEAEAIALAIETNADILLIDEKKGRIIAKNLGLEITGILGILLQSKKSGLVSEIKPVLDSLINTANFFISKNLYNLILEKAGE
ncbi:MAG TPA: DUF3368 domain-containing protein [Phaeodactylibacter sp.]|nr:DUF3368 domain-containing protein [Phaeodactylibacter sp.]